MSLEPAPTTATKMAVGFLLVETGARGFKSKMLNKRIPHEPEDTANPVDTQECNRETQDKKMLSNVTS